MPKEKTIDIDWHFNIHLFECRMIFDVTNNNVWTRSWIVSIHMIYDYSKCLSKNVSSIIIVLVAKNNNAPNSEKRSRKIALAHRVLSILMCYYCCTRTDFWNLYTQIWITFSEHFFHFKFFVSSRRFGTHAHQILLQIMQKMRPNKMNV